MEGYGVVESYLLFVINYICGFNVLWGVKRNIYFVLLNKFEVCFLFVEMCFKK